MTPATHRFFHRLRRQALRAYELGLYATLIALALSVVWSVEGPALTEADAVQCGQNQSSTVVRHR